MPPQRSKVRFPLCGDVSAVQRLTTKCQPQLRRTGTLTGSFYDKSGAIADTTAASSTATGIREAFYLKAGGRRRC